MASCVAESITAHSPGGNPNNWLASFWENRWTKPDAVAECFHQRKEVVQTMSESSNRTLEVAER